MHVQGTSARLLKPFQEGCPESFVCKLENISLFRMNYLSSHQQERCKTVSLSISSCAGKVVQMKILKQSLEHTQAVRSQSCLRRVPVSPHGGHMTCCTSLMYRVAAQIRSSKKTAICLRNHYEICNAYVRKAYGLDDFAIVSRPSRAAASGFSLRCLCIHVHCLWDIPASPQKVSLKCESLNSLVYVIHDSID